MENQLVQKNNEKTVLEGEVIDEGLQSFINDNKILSMIQNGIHHNIRQYDQNVVHFESVNDRYWASQNNYYQITSNEARKYSNYKDEQDRLQEHINNSNFPYGLWRYKKQWNVPDKLDK